MITVSLDMPAPMRECPGLYNINARIKPKTDFSRNLSGTPMDVYNQSYAVGTIRSAVEAFADVHCDTQIKIVVQNGRSNVTGFVRARTVEASQVAQVAVTEIQSIVQTFALRHGKCSFSINYEQTLEIKSIARKS